MKKHPSSSMFSEQEKQHNKNLCFIPTTTRLTSEQVDQVIVKVIGNLQRYYQNKITITLSEGQYHLVSPDHVHEITFSGNNDLEHFTIQTQAKVLYIIKRTYLRMRINNLVVDREISACLTDSLQEEINILLKSK